MSHVIFLTHTHPGLFDFPVTRYRDGPPSLKQFTAFLFRVGWPFFIRNDIQIAMFRVWQKLGGVPQPAADRSAVVQSVYGEIRDLCRAHGAQLVLCVLGHPWDPPRKSEMAQLQAMEGAMVVDAWTALNEALPGKSPDDFQRVYGQYRGNPPRLVDAHPNARAHALTAAAVLRALHAVDDK
jgi:hypothetical protein